MNEAGAPVEHVDPAPTDAGWDRTDGVARTANSRTKLRVSQGHPSPTVRISGHR